MPAKCIGYLLADLIDVVRITVADRVAKVLPEVRLVAQNDIFSRRKCFQPREWRSFGPARSRNDRCRREYRREEAGLVRDPAEEVNVRSAEFSDEVCVLFISDVPGKHEG